MGRERKGKAIGAERTGRDGKGPDGNGKGPNGYFGCGPKGLG
jgi:hypothetical protein